MERIMQTFRQSGAGYGRIKGIERNRPRTRQPAAAVAVNYSGSKAAAESWLPNQAAGGKAISVRVICRIPTPSGRWSRRWGA
jgi:hypothetical protein